jgi:hypothetical protein
VSDNLELRERFEAVDVPPTRLTTTGLLDAGRRRVVRRRTLGAGCGVAVVAALAFAAQSVVAGPPAPSAAAQRLVSCAATRLAVPAGLTEVQAEAVDPRGRYILGNAVTRRGATLAKGEDLDLRPVLWTDGQPQALPLIGASVRASAVNARGMVVAVGGKSDSRGRWSSVIRYVGGVPEQLTAPTGDWVFAALPKIGADGAVLAVAYPRSKPHDPAVLIWKAGSATATRLPLPAGLETLDVTDAGTVVADVADGPGHSVHVWDRQGTSRPLTTPAGAGGYNFAARGEWVTANLTSSGTVARWNLRTGALTDTGVSAPANGVNALGWVIAGDSVQRDDATVDLAAPEGLTGTPVDVSDTGIVVGSVYDYGTSGATPAPSLSGAPGATGPALFSWRCAP